MARTAVFPQQSLLLGIAYLTLLIAASPQTPSFGMPPEDTFGARDLASEYHLPALSDRHADLLYRALAKAQVLARAERLGLASYSGPDAWKGSAAIYQQSVADLKSIPVAHPVVFRGDRASALNRLMSTHSRCVVLVSTPLLLLDEPLYPGNHCRLDLGATRLRSVGFQPYQIQIKGRLDVLLSGGVLTGGRWGVSVAHSSKVVVTGMRMEGLSGGGVMVTNSYRVTVANNHFLALGGAAVMLHGDTQHAVIVANEMRGDTGWSNWHAGIVVTDRNADPADSATTLLRDDGILVQQTRILDRLTIPHDNLIVRNTIVGNKTSGIYSDGGARNLFSQNTVEANSKEGMCLDNGSTGNIVAFNLFRGNGKRWGMSDADLKREFVWSYGRLADGTSPAKLPGISMDNAAYNQVVFNQIDQNYGSGIKMVRTSFYNRIGFNTLSSDNEGANPKLHYFGILVGYASADESAWDLDFIPSRGNQIFANNITGSHSAGIFFGDGADDNVLSTTASSAQPPGPSTTFACNRKKASTISATCPVITSTPAWTPASSHEAKAYASRDAPGRALREAFAGDHTPIGSE